MTKLLLSCVATATALTTVTSVEAHPSRHYRGGCGYFAESDGTDSPQTGWEGEIDAAAVATDEGNLIPAPTASISVECELRINGAAPGTTVLSCSAPGTGFVACAGRLSYTAHPDDIVTMCEQVVVDGEFHEDCAHPDAALLPHPIQQVLDEHVWPLVGQVEDLLDDGLP